MTTISATRRIVRVGRVILGPLRRQNTGTGTTPSYERRCWSPVRFAWCWNRGQQWRPWIREYDGSRPTFYGRFGWETTRETLGAWDRTRDPMTGSATRPHIFGQTILIGPLRIILGPKVGRKYWTRKQLTAKLDEIEAWNATLADQRDQKNMVIGDHVITIEALRSEIAELRYRLDLYEAPTPDDVIAFIPSQTPR